MTQVRQAIAAENIHSFKNTSGSDLLAGTIVHAKNVEGEIGLPAGDATDHCLMVLLHDCKNNEWGDCATGPGRARVIAGGALATITTKLMAASTGKVAAWSAGAGNNRAVVGTQLTTAAADGDLIEVMLAAPDTVHQG